MLLRVSLILAILAGLAVIGVSQFMLRPQIEEIRDQRQKNKEGWDKAEKDLKKTKGTLKETTEKLTKTTATLEETKGQLAATTAKFEQEQKKTVGLQDALGKVSSQLKAAQDDLAAWTNSGVKVDEIKGLIANVKSLQIHNEGLIEENKLFRADIKKKEAQLKQLIGQNEDPPVPRDVRGKVLVVDPKWNFLVLDVGAKIGVPANGVLLVSRNGELIAKVRVMNVQDQRSIANIMPGWKLKDVMEGDVVLAY